MMTRIARILNAQRWVSRRLKAEVASFSSSLLSSPDDEYKVDSCLNHFDLTLPENFYPDKAANRSHTYRLGARVASFESFPMAALSGASNELMIGYDVIEKQKRGSNTLVLLRF